MIKPPKQYSEHEDYWDRRATQYGKKSKGHPAICSYGMPDFYNNHINRLQQHLLLKNLEIKPHMKVVDAGCGVGRWTIAMALKGAHVTGVDISQEMLDLARKRANHSGVGDRVEFIRSPLHLIDWSADYGGYDMVLAVTVLQHIPDQEIWEQSISKLWKPIKKGGKLVLLEVAPTPNSWVKIPSRQHFHPHFKDEYLELLEKKGGVLILEKGMDFLDLKYRMLGWDKEGGIKNGLFHMATLLTEPMDKMLAPTTWGTVRSWHRLMIFQKSRLNLY